MRLSLYSLLTKFSLAGVIMNLSVIALIFSGCVVIKLVIVRPSITFPEPKVTPLDVIDISFFLSTLPSSDVILLLILSTVRDTVETLVVTPSIFLVKVSDIPSA